MPYIVVAKLLVTDLFIPQALALLVWTFHFLVLNMFMESQNMQIV